MSPGRWFGQCPAAEGCEREWIGNVDGAQVHDFAEMHGDKVCGIAGRPGKAEVKQALVVARQKGTVAGTGDEERRRWHRAGVIR